MDEQRDTMGILRVMEDTMPKEDGFEFHKFAIGSYNDAVSPEFQLSYEPSTLAVLLISSPRMFDVSFANWIRSKLTECGSMSEVAKTYPSPIAMFLDERLAELSKKLSAPHDIIHDHHFTPLRRPRILMQTCGHIAGAAYYYQPKNFAAENWPPNKPLEEGSKFIGLSLHPVYGGHFAFRSAIIFPTITINNFDKQTPLSVLETEEEARKMLEEFNYNWRASNFRDFGSPSQRYSPEQLAYFGLAPADRWAYLEQWLGKGQAVGNA